MKKAIITLVLVLLSVVGYAQDTPSYWGTQPENKLELNYQILGNHTAQGAFYGAAGYGMGMWLSNHKTGWGIVGSIVTANLPILIDGRYKETEALLGRNLGAIPVALSATFLIEMNRAGKLNFMIKKPFQK
jgi:hypothetical protein